VKFVVYNGHGNVLTTPVKNDLSEFQHVELDLPAPKTWRVEGVFDNKFRA
jgi:hypothetical protein